MRIKRKGRQEKKPKYLEGYGTSILATLMQPIDYFSSFLMIAINELGTNTLKSLQALIFGVTNFVFTIGVSFENKFVAIIIGLFALMCGVRGIELNYHSMGYMIISALVMSVNISRQIIQGCKFLILIYM